VSTKNERTAAIRARRVATSYREITRVATAGGGRQRHIVGTLSDLRELAEAIFPVMPSTRETVQYEIASLEDAGHLAMLNDDQLQHRAAAWDEVANALAPDVD
jgi:hypothetical protein